MFAAAQRAAVEAGARCRPHTSARIGLPGGATIRSGEGNLRPIGTFKRMINKESSHANARDNRNEHEAILAAMLRRTARSLRAGALCFLRGFRCGCVGIEEDAISGGFGDELGLAVYRDG